LSLRAIQDGNQAVPELDLVKLDSDLTGIYQSIVFAAARLTLQMNACSP